MIKKILILDKEISNRFLYTKNSPLLVWTAKIGGVVFCSILLIIIILVPGKDKFSRLCALALSLAFTTSIVFLLKYTIRRKRVIETHETFVRKFDPFSFPSGHISRLAAFIVPFYPAFFIILFFIFLIAASTYARLCRGYHYLSDIVAGFFIGLFCGYLSVLINSYFLVRRLLSIPLINNLVDRLIIF